MGTSTIHFPAQHQVSDPRIGPPLIIHHDGKSYPIGRPPSVKQWAFFDRSEQEQLYGGSKSGGKSRGGTAKLIMLAVEFPGNQLGMFRQDLTDLKGSTLVTFEQMCPRDLILQHHRTDKYFLIRSKDPRYPSRIWYGGLGDEHDFESAKGKEYGAFYIDEPSEIVMAVYLQMVAQLRWTLPEGFGFYDKETGSWRPPYQALLGSNPEPGWLEDHFGHLISRATEEVPIVTDGQRVYIMALPKDNPYNPPNWEATLRNQKDIPTSWIKKYLEGSWKASEGQVFKELDESVHYIATPPKDFLHRLSLVASLDHATTGVTCFCIDGIDADGNIFALASYYGKNKLISYHSAQIKSMCDHWALLCGKKDLAMGKAALDASVHWSMHIFDYVLIDPSTQAKTQQNKNELWSNQDLYRREGIATVPAWNAIEAGVKLMEEYIHVKPSHIHPILPNHQGSPSFFIVKEFNLEGIKEIEGWKRTITINKSIKYVGPDHWIDNQRYIIMSRPEPPRMVASRLFQMDTHGMMAHRALGKFSDSFGKSPNDGQWFPGGTNTGGNRWFGNS